MKSFIVLSFLLVFVGQSIAQGVGDALFRDDHPTMRRTARSKAQFTSQGDLSGVPNLQATTATLDVIKSSQPALSVETDIISTEEMTAATMTASSMVATSIVSATLISLPEDRQIPIAMPGFLLLFENQATGYTSVVKGDGSVISLEAGTGDVAGPGLSEHERVTLFQGSSGKTLMMAPIFVRSNGTIHSTTGSDLTIRAGDGTDHGEATVVQASDGSEAIRVTTGSSPLVTIKGTRTVVEGSAEVSSLDSSGPVTGASISDGVALLSGGNLSSVGTIEATTINVSDQLAANSMTDGVATIEGGNISGVGTLEATTANVSELVATTVSGNTVNVGDGIASTATVNWDTGITDASQTWDESEDKFSLSGNRLSVGNNSATTVAIEFDNSLGDSPLPQLYYGRRPGSNDRWAWTFKGHGEDGFGSDEIPLSIDDEGVITNNAGLHLFPGLNLNTDTFNSPSITIGDYTSYHIGFRAYSSASLAWPFNTGTGYNYYNSQHTGQLANFATSGIRASNTAIDPAIGGSASFWGTSNFVVNGQGTGILFWKLPGTSSLASQDPDDYPGLQYLVRFGQGNVNFNAQAAALGWELDSEYSQWPSGFYPNDTVPSWVLRGGGLCVAGGPLVVPGAAGSFTDGEPILALATQEDLNNNPGLRRGISFGEPSDAIYLNAVEDASAPYFELTTHTNIKGDLSVGNGTQTTVAIEFDNSLANPPAALEFGHMPQEPTRWAWRLKIPGATGFGIKDITFSVDYDSTSLNKFGVHLLPDYDLQTETDFNNPGFYIGATKTGGHIGMYARNQANMPWPFNSGTGDQYMMELKAGRQLIVPQKGMGVHNSSLNIAGAPPCSYWGTGSAVLLGSFVKLPGLTEVASQDPDDYSGHQILMRYGIGDVNFASEEALLSFLNDYSTMSANLGGAGSLYPNDTVGGLVWRGGGFAVENGPLVVDGRRGQLTQNEPVLALAYNENMNNNPGRRHPIWFGSAATGIELAAVEHASAPYFELTTHTNVLGDLGVDGTAEVGAVSEILDAFISSSPYTAVVGTKYIYADTTSGSIVVNLPPIASSRGSIFDIKLDVLSGANTVTVTGTSGSETIDGSLNYALTLSKETVRVRAPSAGTDWKVH